MLAQILRYDLPLDYRRQQMGLLRETDLETLNELASRLLDPDNLAIVVAGDSDAIRPSLEALEMPIVELDESGLEITAE